MRISQDFAAIFSQCPDREDISAQPYKANFSNCGASQSGQRENQALNQKLTALPAFPRPDTACRKYKTKCTNIFSLPRFSCTAIDQDIIKLPTPQYDPGWDSK
jgi:hypothetical protein